MAMSVNSLLGQLKELDSEKIIAFLGQQEIATYINNPWFLGGMGLLAVCCLIFKWRILLATVIGLTGLSWLINYTVEQGAEIGEGLKSHSLIFFVSVAVVILILMIYLIFIKDE